MSEAETVAVRGELKTALKRVEDLQTAISGELDSENSDGVSSKTIMMLRICKLPSVENLTPKTQMG